jgi:hypothetical protein
LLLRVAAQLVRDDYAWLSSCSPQQLAEEPHGCKPIPLRLDEDVEDNTVLIDGAPEIMRDAVDLQEHLVQKPFIAGSSTAPSQAVCIPLAELVAPPSNRFLADQHAARSHQLFHVAKAHAAACAAARFYPIRSFRFLVSRKRAVTLPVCRRLQIQRTGLPTTAMSGKRGLLVLPLLRRTNGTD